MNSSERFFDHFIDPVDGVLCVPADSLPTEIDAISLAEGLRFPLFLDATIPLNQQVASSPCAPASSRHGGYCDNIMGMNWELPDGLRVRLGERVVKSTTGYDLMRFFLGSGERYGRPLDYVLRLRPFCHCSQTFTLGGDFDALQEASARLLRSSWMHWFESLDIIVEEGMSPTIRIGLHCPPSEALAYSKFLEIIAAEFTLTLQVQDGLALDGLPDLVVKTSPEFVFAQTLAISKHHGVRCVASCYNAVVYVYLADPHAVLDIAVPLESQLWEIGGHWQSRHLASQPQPVELAWIRTLKEALTHS